MINSSKGDCFAMAGLEHLYLYKKRASETGIIEDEKGSLNARLINSNCTKWATSYAEAPIVTEMQNAQNGSVGLWINSVSALNQNPLVLTDATQGSVAFNVFILSKKLVFWHRNGANSIKWTSTVNIADGNWHYVKFTSTDSGNEIEIDGAPGIGFYTAGSANSTFFINDITITDVIIGAGKDNGGIEYNFKGLMADVTIHNATTNKTYKYALAEGQGSTLHDNSEQKDAILYGATLSTFWEERQDFYHYNYQNGFDLWENGTAGEEIRVPIGAIVTEAGYSYTATFPAVVGLNNCESEIDFDDGLAFAYDPLGYPNFQVDFDDRHEVFSCVKDKDHKNIRFYNPALSDSDAEKLKKCFIKKGCDEY